MAAEDFETEGDVRTWLNDNPEQAVQIQTPVGDLWFTLNDNSLVVYRGQGPTIETMPPQGDDMELPPGATSRIDAADVPDEGDTFERADETTDPLTAALEAAMADMEDE
jgi:hypothetical protein